MRKNAKTKKEKAKWAEGGEYKALLHAVAAGIVSSMAGTGFASGAAGDGLSQLAQKQLANITDPNLRLIASSIVGAAAAKVVGGNAQAGAGTAYNGVMYNDYNHRTHREGEIVHTKDGFFQVINGVDTAIAPPPAGVYFWEQDANNSEYGWDYLKGDGVTTQDTYFPGTVDSRAYLKQQLYQEYKEIIDENDNLLLLAIAGREAGLGRMTTKQATAAAQELGFQKTGSFSHGQPVYKKGNMYITPDVDGHNGGVWKAARSVEDLGSKSTRLGTYDANLNRIGD